MNINTTLMKSELTYKIIKTELQYNEYCRILEQLAVDGTNLDEIELLTLLIEKWDQEHQYFGEDDPVELLKYLMAQRQLKAKDLVEVLGVSKGLVSDILNRKKGMSKEVIRVLSNHFKVAQEAFNKPYRVTQQPLARGRRTSARTKAAQSSAAH